MKSSRKIIVPTVKNIFTGTRPFPVISQFQNIQQCSCTTPWIPCHTTNARQIYTSTPKFSSGFSEVSYEQLLEILDKKSAVVIDVRNPEELAKLGAIPGAVNIPLGELEVPFYIDMFRDGFSKKKIKTIICICRVRVSPHLYIILCLLKVGGGTLVEG